MFCFLWSCRSDLRLEFSDFICSITWSQDSNSFSKFSILLFNVLVSSYSHLSPILYLKTFILSLVLRAMPLEVVELFTKTWDFLLGRFGALNGSFHKVEQLPLVLPHVVKLTEKLLIHFIVLIYADKFTLAYHLLQWSGLSLSWTAPNDLVSHSELPSSSTQYSADHADRGLKSLEIKMEVPALRSIMY